MSCSPVLAGAVLPLGALPEREQGNVLCSVPGVKPQIHVAACSAPKGPPLEGFGLGFGIVLRRKVEEKLLYGH